MSLDANGNQALANIANATDVIRSAGGSNVYQTIINHFTTRHGYREGVDFFTYPYDWRRDMRLTGASLGVKINEALAGRPHGSQVILICHSMGCLVAAAHMVDAVNGVANRARIQHAFMVGGPFFGAPKAWYSMRFGMESPLPSFLPTTPNPAEYRDIVKNMPGPYQLIPSQSWFNYARDGFVRMGGRTLTTDDDTYTILADRDWNQPMVADAAAFHREIDAGVPHFSALSTFMIGRDVSAGTIRKVVVAPASGGTFAHQVADQPEGRSADGDGTVLNIGIREAFPGRVVEFTGNTAEHLNLIRNTDVLQAIATRMVTMGATGPAVVTEVGDAETAQLAAELLSVTSDHEIEQFLSRLISQAGGPDALVTRLAPAVKRALPMLGTHAGTMGEVDDEQLFNEFDRAEKLVRLASAAAGRAQHPATLSGRWYRHGDGIVIDGA
jgi:hypothetical protein